MQPKTWHETRVSFQLGAPSGGARKVDARLQVPLDVLDLRVDDHELERVVLALLLRLPAPRERFPERTVVVRELHVHEAGGLGLLGLDDFFHRVGRQLAFAQRFSRCSQGDWFSGMS